METSSKPRHIGRNISRLRELRGMKQDALAQALGVSQQSVSVLENSEEVDETRLKEVAEALGVSVEGIKNFNEEVVLNIISNTFNSNDSSTMNAINLQPTFNPLDKLIEAYEENKKLYERLIDELRDKKTK
ncbi:MAG: XRE family transcriptional regulator [Chitinophagaceae bacterium]|nr:MAG: XRE family transcriptional regulator [Chitinophagaceae bacterium]